MKVKSGDLIYKHSGRSDNFFMDDLITSYKVIHIKKDGCLRDIVWVNDGDFVEFLLPLSYFDKTKKEAVKRELYKIELKISELKEKRREFLSYLKELMENEI